MKTIKVMILVLSFIALACVGVGIVTRNQEQPREGQILAAAQIEVPCFIQHGNIYDKLFVEPFEIGVFVFNNGKIFTFTNQIPGGVFYPDFLQTFKDFGLTLSNCVLHIHNHLEPSDFSDADKKFALYLRSHGFKGQIALYIQPTKEVKFL